MTEINYLAVVAAAVVAFMVGAVWYSPLLFGNQLMELRSASPGVVAGTTMPAWKILVEFGRGLVVAYVLALLLGLLGDFGWRGALQLGVWVWVGFPITLLVGSVIWENTPWQLAAIHAGDWLVKLLLIAVILGVWR
jgi:hypothetical protein